jgi:hypothetical protein
MVTLLFLILYNQNFKQCALHQILIILLIDINIVLINIKTIIPENFDTLNS